MGDNSMYDNWYPGQLDWLGRPIPDPNAANPLDTAAGGIDYERIDPNTGYRTFADEMAVAQGLLGNPTGDLSIDNDRRRRYEILSNPNIKSIRPDPSENGASIVIYNDGTQQRLGRNEGGYYLYLNSPDLANVGKIDGMTDFSTLTYTDGTTVQAQNPLAEGKSGNFFESGNFLPYLGAAAATYGIGAAYGAGAQGAAGLAEGAGSAGVGAGVGEFGALTAGELAAIAAEDAAMASAGITAGSGAMPYAAGGVLGGAAGAGALGVGAGAGAGEFGALTAEELAAFAGEDAALANAGITAGSGAMPYAAGGGLGAGAAGAAAFTPEELALAENGVNFAGEGALGLGGAGSNAAAGLAGNAALGVSAAGAGLSALGNAGAAAANGTDWTKLLTNLGLIGANAGLQAWSANDAAKAAEEAANNNRNWWKANAFPNQALIDARRASASSDLATRLTESKRDFSEEAAKRGLRGGSLSGGLSNIERGADRDYAKLANDLIQFQNTPLFTPTGAAMSPVNQTVGGNMASLGAGLTGMYYGNQQQQAINQQNQDYYNNLISLYMGGR